MTRATQHLFLAFTLGLFLAFTLGLLLGVGAVDAAQPRSAPQAIQLTTRTVVDGDVLPPLPDSVPSVRGWVPVQLVDPPLMCDTVPAWGCYDYGKRVIRIERGPGRWHSWLTLEHEKVHMTLGDARLIHGLRDETNADIDDDIAEAIANQRMLERLVPTHGRTVR